ncbi:hypothetical protein B4N89_20660 [Embleya scabrispora]|uniref:HTH merR-type domain-containing protein n=2 Tax=Embleya scabrispora TaxID=159449 RepID=A0A1T3P1Q2_9ACTN|nr:hypothetical protein B4N89_20660 [Embleya scabrispora]
MLAFTIVAGLLVLTVIVGMRVSWVPLRDTAVDVGLGEVRRWYPLAIDGLDGVAIIAAITLYGRAGYRAAMGTVVGLTAVSTVLNVAHGLEAARVTHESASMTWAHVTLAAAAPNLCIALGAHLVAVMLQRVRGLLDVWLAQRATRAPKTAKVERKHAKAAPTPEPQALEVAAEAPAGEDTDTHDRADDATGEPEMRPASAEPEPARITASQAAGMLGVHPATFRDWAANGIVPLAGRNELGWKMYARADVEKLVSSAN